MTLKVLYASITKNQQKGFQMFIIYANSELEQKQKAKKPEDYRIQDTVAREIFQTGCKIVKKESERFQKVCHKTQHLPREFLKREIS